jgi:hypothetical protein
MTNQRQILLHSIATTVGDYRQGEIPPIDSNHVDRWVKQFAQFGFGDQEQIVILEEMEKILKSYYFSLLKARSFIACNFLTPNHILGANPTVTIKNVKFLDIQTKGSSQKDLLNLFEPILEQLCGFRLNDCGQSPVAYVYLDDCLYTGNTVLRDIEGWISSAIKGTTLHLVFFALHTYGRENVKQRITPQATKKGVKVEFWHCKSCEFYNSRNHPSQFDCFWPRLTSGDQLLDTYVQEVKERCQNQNRALPPLFRPDNMPTQDNIFSSPSARKVIESAFLKAGLYIISLSQNPKMNKPLGYEYHSGFESLGFGATFVTYRNIANNCPLALWWGGTDKEYPLNQWYPLFPRIVNTTSTSDLEDF